MKKMMEKRISPAAARTAAVCFALLAAAVMALVPARAHASAYDSSFTTPSFVVDINALENHTVEYTERISVHFSTPRHGIYRYIPTSRDYRIRIDSVSGGQYKTERESGSLIIRIGSENEQITGDKTYTIRYRLIYYRDRNKYGDELSLDVIPANWTTGIGSAKVTLHLPDGMKPTAVQTYSGGYGSNEDEYGAWTNSGSTYVYQAKNLPEHVGATFYAALPEGSWKNVPLMTTADMIYTVLALAALAWMILSRLRVRAKYRVVPTVEFYPPEDMSPAELGYVIDDECEERDITALLFSLAAEGCVHIRKEEKDFSFVKVKNPPAKKKFLMRYFKILFGRDAEKAPAGTTVELSELQSTLGKKYDALRNAVIKEFSGEKKIYSSESENVMLVVALLPGVLTLITTAYLMILAGGLTDSVLGDIAICFTAGVIPVLCLSGVESAITGRHSRSVMKTGLWFLGSLLFYLAIAVIVGYVMYKFVSTACIGAFAAVDAAGLLLVGNAEKRTKWGAEIYGKVIGFRNFIDAAEAQRLEVLLEENPNYFYEMLPYAYVFGLADKWARNFRDIRVEEADWFEGTMTYGTMFALSAMESSMDQIARKVRNEVQETSSSFSGSSGGGSGVGGGGGGGGGGSW